MKARVNIIYSQMTRLCPVAFLFLFVSLSMVMPLASAKPYYACGSLDNSYGPFDYRNSAFVKNLDLVEGAHFTGEVEALERGHTAAMPGHDLDYTLRAFPNHHRALNAMARYQIRFPGGVPPEAAYTAECYFERATRFAPDDAIVRMLRGIYYAKTGKNQKALDDYKYTLKTLPDSSQVHYNIGLLYVKLKDFEMARKHAKRAYEIGFPLPGLRDQLKRAGEWEK